MERMQIDNEHEVRSLGKCKKWNREEQGITIETDSGMAKVMIYNDHVFRIRINKKTLDYNDFSYAVVSKPVKTLFEVEENQEVILIKTNYIHLEVTKDPVRFSFFTSENKLINEDDQAIGTCWIGNEVTTYKQLQPDEKFIGLGEKNGNLNRRGKNFVNWNYDYFAYPTNADPIYLANTFYIGIHNHLAYGIFFDNTYKTTFNFGGGNDRFSYFSAVEGEMDYYFIYDENVKKIIEHYSWLTGRMPLPPKWSLGFQQCRYSYYPDTELLIAANSFRQKHIPADVLYLDIHYMEKYKAFTWNDSRFPAPDKMMRKLQKLGFHLVLIVDPGIKIEEGYKFYEDGLKNNYFALYPDNTPYTGNVWPGWCHFPDYTDPRVRKWWGSLYETYTKDGIDGFWNDMNEPAVWGKELPDIVLFNYDGKKATHRKAHNVYGMLMARSTYEGVKKLLNGKRPFVLTRAGYNGVQRFAAVWTGDNIANNEHMMNGIRLVNSLGVSGIPFSGYDVGGFAGEASPDLYARWLSIGAFSPFFRAHSMINSRDAEPWTFGEEVEEISRNYINLRYRLMPYIYSTFFEASELGTPVCRTLAIDYTHLEEVYDYDFQNEYLFGPFILVAPVESYEGFEKIFLPPGKWFDLYTDQVCHGPEKLLAEAPKEKLPVFIREGAIIPMQSIVQSMAFDPEDVLYIHIYHSDHTSEFCYYEDDGVSYDYQTGEFYKRWIKFEPGKREIIFTKADGRMNSYFKRIRVYFHGFENLKEMIAINNRKSDLQIEEEFRFVEPISNFDPWHYEPDLSKVIYDLPYIEFPNSDEKFVVEY